MEQKTSDDQETPDSRLLVEVGGVIAAVIASPIALVIAVDTYRVSSDLSATLELTYLGYMYFYGLPIAILGLIPTSPQI